MKALVTGGGGFLGGAIVRLLRAARRRGAVVHAVARTRGSTSSASSRSRGDLADPEAVERAVAGCDVVFHVAAKAGVWGRYADFFDTNVTGTENVIAACQKHGVRKLVYTCTPSVVLGGGDIEGGNESLPYPKHFDAHYPETKAMAEKAVLAANGPDLATVALRPHLIWGPGDPHLIPRIIARARDGQAPPHRLAAGQGGCDLHRQRRRRAPPRRRPARHRFAARGQGVLHLERRAGGVVGVHRPRPGRGRAAAGDAARLGVEGPSSRAACWNGSTGCFACRASRR